MRLSTIIKRFRNLPVASKRYQGEVDRLSWSLKHAITIYSLEGRYLKSYTVPYV